ncbi:MAG: sterol desaturase family protein [Xanthomonadaceae bacterium]|nr:sterol desaturase family protein [Xanthomonadaceae bacterium]
MSRCVIIHSVLNSPKMIFDVTKPALLIFGITLAFMFVRYAVLAGGTYFLVYHGLKEGMKSRKIEKKSQTQSDLRREISYSVITMFIFALSVVLTQQMRVHGMTKIYDHVSDHGWPYWFLSIFLIIVTHDLYFYVTHRLMHIPGIFEHVHRVHHLSTNPTPFACFAFHPIEAAVQTLILPLVAILFPIHVGAFFIFFMLIKIFNVLGHLGYEIYPRGHEKSWLFNVISTPTNHNQHHATFNYNYGLYTVVWDKLMKTVHPNYAEKFKSVTS